MGQTLTNGVYLPDNGERNCYVGLSQNWQKLDNLLGNKGDKVSFSQTLTEGVEIGKITINGVDIAMYSKDYTSELEAKADTSIINMDNYVDITDTFNSLMDNNITPYYYTVLWEPLYDGWLTLNIDATNSRRILIECLLSETVSIRLFDLTSLYTTFTVPIQKNKKYRIITDVSSYSCVMFIPNT